MNLRNTVTIVTLCLTTIGLIPASVSAYDTITCDSRNGRYNSCYVGGGRIKAVRQLSNASCDGNWNYDGQRIAVRNGCRAQFVIDNGNWRGYDRPDYRDNYYDHRGNYYEERDNYYDRSNYRRYERPYYRQRNYRCNGYDYRCN
ncbi:MAG: hypothetical protein N5P05_000968 [Chroococcopsis gigantea SAG 12.99]|jgi:hypothetical protein|nr:DUF3011 domain-containing protein [Chlorogloea purpurea SAG 13.99]MDV2999362.1 hypothetical protein [Chroococcopsis gigantea SAG 12.99]